MNVYAEIAAVSPMQLQRNKLRNRLLFVVAFVAIAALMPALVDNYWQRVLIFTFVNIALASSWNIIGGLAGYPSFGHAVFFGIGAYTAAIMIVRWGLPFPAGIVGGGIIAAAISVLFVPMFRLRGFYFALATLAGLLAIDNIVRNWSFTRGMRPEDLGWSFPDVGGLIFFYYLVLALLGVCLASIAMLHASRVGYALTAIRKDEIVATSVGVPATRYKTYALLFSAFWPGVLGAVYGPFLVFISPDNVFNLNITLNMILVTIFGGIGTLVGPVLGGAVLSVIDQVAWGNFLEYHHLINGILIVLIIRFLPGGIVALPAKFRRNGK